MSPKNSYELENYKMNFFAKKSSSFFLNCYNPYIEENQWKIFLFF
jgi:hypothetical protein